MSPKKRMRAKRGTVSHRAIHVPIEIVDHILNLLESDDDITPCSVSVGVRNEPGATVRFTQFLEQNPIVRGWVRKLRIMGSEYDFWNIWCSKNFVMMAQSLDNLYAVSFGHGLGTEALLPYASQPNISDCEDIILRKHLSGFKNIRESVISDSEYFWTASYLPFQKISPPLTSISITHTSPPLERILSGESLKSLQFLHFEFYALYDYSNPTITFVMTSVGKSLRTLVLDIRRPSVPSFGLCGTSVDWDAHSLSGLRELEVRLDPSHRAALTVMHNLACVPVELMTLKISFNRAFDFPRHYDDGAAALDGVFSLPAFQNLKSCRFVYTGCLKPSAAFRIVKKRLPSLWSRNIEVVFGKERYI
ncbi:hypothetical protein EIP91_002384 [Steccherinum ochraceum]|uniref:F-box domain-containing protein n=1 Tax=Steccherinum ochraceum TaxID=92696 RepID=A0A4R0RTG1_9APHY|nr:hypothetical protein EIP91_002384 [Steccherinum ochraceum]